eukprot:6492523-Amphidinium_carterae.1
MQQAWVQRKKGSKVAMARFGNWMAAAQAFDECWHTQLIRLVWLGFQEGYLKTTSFPGLQDQAKALRKEGTGEDKQQTKKSANQAAAALKMNGANALQLVVLLLSDTWNQKRCRMQVVLAEPLMQWHTEQSKSLRSTMETREWLMAQLGGELLTPLQGMWALLKKESVLQRVSIVRPSDRDVAEGMDTPRYAEDAKLCELCGQWVTELVAARVKRLLWMTRSWQGLFLLVAHPSESRRVSVMEELHKQWLAFEEAEGRAEPFWQQVVERSEFRTMPVLQLVQACKRAEWKVTEELQSMARERASIINQSKMSEDAFQKGRRKEDTQANKLMGEKALWKHWLDSGLVGTLHRFQPVDCSGEPLPASGDIALSKGVFQPNVQQSPEELKRITAQKSKKNQWFSTTVPGANIVHADVKLMRVAKMKNSWAEVHLNGTPKETIPRVDAHTVMKLLCEQIVVRSSTFRKAACCGEVADLHGWSTLLRAKSVAFRQSTLDVWLLSLGDICGEVVLAWPLRFRGTLPDGRIVVEPAADAPPRLEVIVDPNSVHAVSLKWLGPWEARMSNSVLSGAASSGLVLVSDGRPVKLLELAARHSFYDLAPAQLQWIAERTSFAIDATLTEPEQVKLLVQHIIPEVSVQELESILRLRFSESDDLLEELLLTTSSIEEYIHTSDIKDLEDCAHQEQKKKEEKRHYARDLVRCLADLGCETVTKKKMVSRSGKKYKTKLPVSAEWTKDIG